LKTQVHQVLGKEGVIPELDDIFRGNGPRWLDDLQLGDVYLELAISPSAGRVVMTLDGTAVPTRWVGRC
jgi:hypothetical protein